MRCFKKEITKNYWAVVKINRPQQEGKLEHFLLKDEARNKSKARKQVKIVCLKVSLEYKVLASL